MHFIDVHLQDTLESFRNHARTHLISPPYAREHVFQRARVCLWKRGEKEKRKGRRTRRRKKMSISGTLWGLTCPQSEIHVTLVTEPRCALERSSWTTELFVALTSRAFYWLDGWEEETWRGKPPSSIGRGLRDDDESEGEKEREEERSTSRNCMCGWEETYGARSCHAVQLCAIVTSSVVYPHVPYCPFFSFFFWGGEENSSSFPNRERRDKVFVTRIALCYASSEIRLSSTLERIFT